MDKFKVEKQYQLYLQRVALSESTMHLEQKRQLRQTFFGAWGQCLLCMRDDISELSEDKGIDVLEDMLKEIGDYFLSVADRKN